MAENTKAPKIKIEGLCKYWGDVKAVDNLNLDINEGDFITLLGPSGCGKTTTLRAIAGLEHPTKGTIKINNNVVFDKKQEIIVEPSKRDIGLIFQSYALWPHMTVYNNVAFGLKIKKLPKDEIDKRVEQSLADVRLNGMGYRYPAELSGGQQQRVAIARMLINRPGTFLMDEPLSNLDARLRIEMRSELKQLHQRSGATTVYVTHDQEEAMTISSKICVMKDGVIQQLAAPEEVYRKPANLFVAGFIANPEMNFFDAKVETVDGKVSVVANGLVLPVDEKLLKGKKNVILAIRPEDFEISAKGAEFHVDAQLPAGASQIVMCSKDGKNVCLLFDGNVPVNAGEQLKVSVKPELFNVFDAETEERLY